MDYIVFTDAHLHKFNDFSKSSGRVGNTRLENQLDAIKDILEVARTKNKIVLFLGDLFHQRGRVDTQVFNEAYNLFNEFSDVTIYAIEGNHDNVDNSITSYSSLEPFKYLKNFHLIETYKKVTIPNSQDTFVGISYGEEYDELKQFIKDNKATFLLAHLGVEGSYGAGISKLDGPFSTGDLLVPSNYELALLGHYHRRQQVSKNVYYVGNPVAQNFSDSEQEKGYMTFSTKDGHIVKDSVEFKPLDYPMFIKVTDENLSKYADDLDSLAEHNYVRVVLNEDVFNKLKISDELEELPENLRVEKQVFATTESRIDIKEAGSTIMIAKKWAEEFQPDNIKTITQQLKKVL